MNINPLDMIKISGCDEHNREVERLQDIQIAERRHRESLSETREANRLAEEANKIATEANKIAKRAFVVSIISVVTAVASILTAIFLGIFL